MPAPPPLPQPVCTTSEAAQRLGVSNTTVQGMVERGELLAWKTPGGHRRISRAALDAMCAARGTTAVGDDALAVLLVDADTAEGQRLATAIAGWGLPLRLYLAHDALDALLLVERHRPALVAVAWTLAPVDGLALLQRLRRHAEFDSTGALLYGAIDAIALAARGGAPRGTVLQPGPLATDRLRGLVDARMMR